MATTIAVTASRVAFAPENESAISAPNAGPPVTWSCRASGRPVVETVRRRSISSVSANPLSCADTGTPPIAAAPSGEVISRTSLGSADVARATAARAADRSASLSAAPSARETTSTAEAESASGNCASACSICADWLPSGSEFGASPADSFSPTAPITPIAAIASTSSNHHDLRELTVAAYRLQISTGEPSQILNI